MVHVVNPPEIYKFSKNISIFLAGSIEMGKAEDWQKKVIDSLEFYNLTVYNPRRNDWNSDWEQKIYDKNFKEQVEWELNHIEKSNYVVFYFQKDTISPITLLELGICAEKKPEKTIVCCPEGYFRKGNVDIVCEKYNIPVLNTLDELIKKVQNISVNNVL